MVFDQRTEQLILRCRALSSGINDYFEEQRYLLETENPDEITPSYLLEAALSLVLDLLESIGITTKYTVDDLLDSSADLETMFYIASKFDADNYYRMLASFDAEQRSEYAATLENIDLPEDYFFELSSYFNDLFPLDIGWEYIVRGTDHWFSNSDFATHICNIQEKLELLEDDDTSTVPVEELPLVTRFLQVMSIREDKVKACVGYILEKFGGLLDKSKLNRMVKQYDKEKLHPDKILLFSKWNALTEEQKHQIGEPNFLKLHHLSDDHHIEHWEDLKKKKQLVPLLNETAVMIVISLILDDLPEEKMRKEIGRYRDIASPETFQFMWDLYRHVPWKTLLGSIESRGV